MLLFSIQICRCLNYDFKWLELRRRYLNGRNCRNADAYCTAANEANLRANEPFNKSTNWVRWMELSPFARLDYEIVLWVWKRVNIRSVNTCWGTIKDILMRFCSKTYIECLQITSCRLFRANFSEQIASSWETDLLPTNKKFTLKERSWMISFELPNLQTSFLSKRGSFCVAVNWVESDFRILVLIGLNCI